LLLSERPPKSVPRSRGIGFVSSGSGVGLQPLEIVVCDRDCFGDALSCLWKAIRLESISEAGQCRSKQDDHKIA
jgi:hypothetical protein